MAARAHTLSFHPVHTPKDIAVRLDAIDRMEDQPDHWAPLPLMFTPMNSEPAQWSAEDDELPY